MREKKEQRNYFRIDVDCDITYKFLDSDEVYHGQCKSLSGAGIFFTTEQTIETGLGLEVNIPAKAFMDQPINAFIEVVRSACLEDNSYEILG